MKSRGIVALNRRLARLGRSEPLRGSAGRRHPPLSTAWTGQRTLVRGRKTFARVRPFRPLLPSTAARKTDRKTALGAFWPIARQEGARVEESRPGRRPDRSCSWAPPEERSCDRPQAQDLSRSRPPLAVRHPEHDISPACVAGCRLSGRP